MAERFRELRTKTALDAIGVRLTTQSDDLHSQGVELKLRTLMHDPTYRSGIAWQNVAYNQPPYPGLFLGTGMQAPSKPNIYFPRR